MIFLVVEINGFGSSGWRLIIGVAGVGVGDFGGMVASLCWTGRSSIFCMVESSQGSRFGRLGESKTGGLILRNGDFSGVFSRSCSKIRVGVGVVSVITLKVLLLVGVEGAWCSISCFSSSSQNIPPFPAVLQKLFKKILNHQKRFRKYGKSSILGNTKNSFTTDITRFSMIPLIKSKLSTRFQRIGSIFNLISNPSS